MAYRGDYGLGDYQSEQERLFELENNPTFEVDFTFLGQDFTLTEDNIYADEDGGADFDGMHLVGNAGFSYGDTYTNEWEEAFNIFPAEVQTQLLAEGHNEDDLVKALFGNDGHQQWVETGEVDSSKHLNPTLIEEYKKPEYEGTKESALAHAASYRNSRQEINDKLWKLEIDRAHGFVKTDEYEIEKARLQDNFKTDRLALNQAATNYYTGANYEGDFDDAEGNYDHKTFQAFADGMGIVSDDEIQGVVDAIDAMDESGEVVTDEGRLLALSMDLMGLDGSSMYLDQTNWNIAVNAVESTANRLFGTKIDIPLNFNIFEMGAEILDKKFVNAAGRPVLEGVTDKVGWLTRFANPDQIAITFADMNNLGKQTPTGENIFTSVFNQFADNMLEGPILDSVQELAESGSFDNVDLSDAPEGSFASMVKGMTDFVQDLGVQGQKIFGPVLSRFLIDSVSVSAGAGPIAAAGNLISGLMAPSTAEDWVNWGIRNDVNVSTLQEKDISYWRAALDNFFNDEPNAVSNEIQYGNTSSLDWYNTLNTYTNENLGFEIKDVPASTVWAGLAEEMSKNPTEPLDIGGNFQVSMPILEEIRKSAGIDARQAAYDFDSLYRTDMPSIENYETPDYIVSDGGDDAPFTLANTSAQSNVDLSDITVKVGDKWVPYDEVYNEDGTSVDGNDVSPYAPVDAMEGIDVGDELIGSQTDVVDESGIRYQSFDTDENGNLLIDSIDVNENHGMDQEQYSVRATADNTLEIEDWDGGSISLDVNNQEKGWYRTETGEVLTGQTPPATGGQALPGVDGFYTGLQTVLEGKKEAGNIAKPYMYYDSKIGTFVAQMRDPVYYTDGTLNEDASMAQAPRPVYADIESKEWIEYTSWRYDPDKKIYVDSTPSTNNLTLAEIDQMLGDSNIIETGPRYLLNTQNPEEPPVAVPGVNASEKELLDFIAANPNLDLTVEDIQNNAQSPYTDEDGNIVLNALDVDLNLGVPDTSIGGNSSNQTNVDVNLDDTIVDQNINNENMNTSNTTGGGVSSSVSYGGSSTPGFTPSSGGINTSANSVPVNPNFDDSGEDVNIRYDGLYERDVNRDGRVDYLTDANGIQDGNNRYYQGDQSYSYLIGQQPDGPGSRTDSSMLEKPKLTLEDLKLGKAVEDTRPGGLSYGDLNDPYARRNAYTFAEVMSLTAKGEIDRSVADAWVNTVARPLDNPYVKNAFVNSVGMQAMGATMDDDIEKLNAAFVDVQLRLDKYADDPVGNLLVDPYNQNYQAEYNEDGYNISNIDTRINTAVTAALQNAESEFAITLNEAEFASAQRAVADYMGREDTFTLEQKEAAVTIASDAAVKQYKDDGFVFNQTNIDDAILQGIQNHTNDGYQFTQDDVDAANAAGAQQAEDDRIANGIQFTQLDITNAINQAITDADIPGAEAAAAKAAVQNYVDNDPTVKTIDELNSAVQVGAQVAVDEYMARPDTFTAAEASAAVTSGVNNYINQGYTFKQEDVNAASSAGVITGRDEVTAEFAQAGIEFTEADIQSRIDAKQLEFDDATAAAEASFQQEREAAQIALTGAQTKGAEDLAAKQAELDAESARLDTSETNLENKKSELEAQIGYELPAINRNIALDLLGYEDVTVYNKLQERDAGYKQIVPGSEFNGLTHDERIQVAVDDYMGSLDLTKINETNQTQIQKFVNDMVGFSMSREFWKKDSIYYQNKIFDEREQAVLDIEEAEATGVANVEAAEKKAALDVIAARAAGQEDITSYFVPNFSFEDYMTNYLGWEASTEDNIYINPYDRSQNEIYEIRDEYLADYRAKLDTGPLSEQQKDRLERYVYYNLNLKVSRDSYAKNATEYSAQRDTAQQALKDAKDKFALDLPAAETAAAEAAVAEYMLRSDTFTEEEQQAAAQVAADIAVQAYQDRDDTYTFDQAQSAINAGVAAYKDQGYTFTEADVNAAEAQGFNAGEAAGITAGRGQVTEEFAAAGIEFTQKDIQDSIDKAILDADIPGEKAEAARIAVEDYIKGDLTIFTQAELTAAAEVATDSANKAFEDAGIEFTQDDINTAVASGVQAYKDEGYTFTQDDVDTSRQEGFDAGELLGTQTGTEAGIATGRAEVTEEFKQAGIQYTEDDLNTAVTTAITNANIPAQNAAAAEAAVKSYIETDDTIFTQADLESAAAVATTAAQEAFAATGQIYTQEELDSAITGGVQAYKDQGYTFTEDDINQANSDGFSLGEAAGIQATTDEFAQAGIQFTQDDIDTAVTAEQTRLSEQYGRDLTEAEAAAATQAVEEYMLRGDTFTQDEMQANVDAAIQDRIDAGLVFDQGDIESKVTEAVAEAERLAGIQLGQAETAAAQAAVEEYMAQSDTYTQAEADAAAQAAVDEYMARPDTFTQEQANAAIGAAVAPYVTGTGTGTGVINPIVDEDLDVDTTPGGPTIDTGGADTGTIPEIFDDVDGNGTIGGVAEEAVTDTESTDDFDISYEYAKQVGGADFAEDFRGVGLQGVISVAERFDLLGAQSSLRNQAAIAEEQTEVASQLRNLSKQSDLDLVEQFGAEYAQSIRSLSPEKEEILGQTMDLARTRFDRSKGRLSARDKATARNEAFRLGQATGRTYDPIQQMTLLGELENVRTAREDAALNTGSFAFNMADAAQGDVTGLLLGQSPFAGGISTVTPPFGSVSATNLGLQNYQNNAQAQQYQQGLGIARNNLGQAVQTTKPSGVDRLGGYLQTGMQGLQLADYAFGTDYSQQGLIPGLMDLGGDAINKLTGTRNVGTSTAFQDSLTYDPQGGGLQFVDYSNPFTAASNSFNLFP